MQAAIRFTYYNIAIENQPCFQLAVIALLLLFILWVILFLKNYSSLEMLLHVSAPREPHIYASSGADSDTSRFVMQFVLHIIWSALLSLVILRLSYHYPFAVDSSLSGGDSPFRFVAMLFVAMLALWVYQWIFVVLVGVIGEANTWAKSTLESQFSSGALGAVVTTPLLFLIVIYSHITPSFLFYTIAIIIGVTVLNDIFYSFRLFVIQKLSILDWFLYLCAVKLIPLSFIWRILVVA